MKKANPKTVGGFVIGAVILAVIAVGVFGGGRFFEESVKLVAFFPGSHMGLREGAPVEMRGIQVGKVTEIWVEVDEDTLEFTIPVVMEVDLSRIRGADESRDSRAEELIEKGFRAQLVAQSLVTGQQSIQFDFHPGTPVRLVQTDLPYTQVPTIPSAFEEIESSVDELAKTAGVVLAQVNDLLSQENRARLAQMLDASNETLAAYAALAKRAEGILAENQEGIGKAVAGLREVEIKVAALSDAATKLVADNRKGIGDFASTGLYEFTNLAIDAQAAVEQFRRVMEEMERDPARFLLGKPGEVEVQ